MKRLSIALSVLAAVAVAAWIVGRQQDREARLERSEGRLLSFDDRAVTGLSMRFEDVDWRFVRTDAGWRVDAPVRDAANDAAIGELLSVMRRTRVARVLESPDALAEYGLDPPRRVIGLQGVEAPELSVGDPTLTGDGLYVQVADRPGVLVLELLEGMALIAVEPGALRDPDLSGVALASVIGVTLDRAGERVRLERDGEVWWITEPLRIPADPASVDRLLAALNEAGIDRFLDGADPGDAAFGLEDGAVRVAIHTPEGSRGLRLGAKAPGGAGRYALREDRPVVLVTAADPLADAPSTLRGLASPRLSDVNRYQVTRFTYRKGAARLAAVREGEREWKTAGGGELPSDRIYALLASALNSRLRDWRSGSIDGESPLASLEFELEDGTADRIDYFSGRRARLGSLPGVIYELAADPPEVPAG